MTITIAPSPPSKSLPNAPPEPPAPSTAELRGISWATYEALLRDVDAAGQRMRITYDRGRMTISSPLPIHERKKKRIGRMIELICLELDIPLASFGSATWRRADAARGLESDECYYVQNEPSVRGRTDIDLTRDPPPDLAVEVEVTHHPIDRQAVYAALGVPELWHYEGARLTALLLQEDGSYRSSPASLAFPFLRPSDLERFLLMLPTTGETSLMRAFRGWVRTDLAPPAGA